MTAPRWFPQQGDDKAVLLTVLMPHGEGVQVETTNVGAGHLLAMWHDCLMIFADPSTGVLVGIGVPTYYNDGRHEFPKQFVSALKELDAMDSLAGLNVRIQE